MELQLFDVDAQQQALLEALEEAAPSDYCGGRPPARSYEVLTKGVELFAFSWQSGHFGRKMYLKFGIVKEAVVFYSIHPSRR